MTDPSLNEQLVAIGWKLFYRCDCPSGKKEYFNHVDHPKYAIRTRLREQTFRIVYENHVIAGPFRSGQMEEKIAKYVT